MTSGEDIWVWPLVAVRSTLNTTNPSPVPHVAPLHEFTQPQAEF
jgi:hypothetical protein